MIWLAAAMGAMALKQGLDAKNQAKADQITAKSTAKVENMRRDIDNMMSKAKGDLARFQQARSNKYALQSGGRAEDTATVNMLRLSDQAVRGSIEMRIAAAEEAGALAARVGFAGVGGGSVEMLNNTNAVRQQRARELSDTMTDTQLFDMGEQKAFTREQTILGLDDIQFADGMNFMRAQEQYIKQPSWFEVGANAAMAFGTSYASMGGFKGWGSGTPQISGDIQAVGNMPNSALA